MIRYEVRDEFTDWRSIEADNPYAAAEVWARVQDSEIDHCPLGMLDELRAVQVKAPGSNEWANYQVTCEVSVAYLARRA